MNIIPSRPAWLLLVLGLCLWTTSSSQAQQQGSMNRSSTSSAYRGTSTGNRSSGGSSSSSSGSTRDYNNNTMVGDATITSDPETRRLIVITDDETAANISQVISNLDRPKPQVLIKVVFLEVTHDNSLDLGLEGGYSKNVGGGGPVGNTLSASNIFGLGAMGANPSGAGLYQALGNDYQATIRAIATAGKTEILSRPSILVRNNQPATITVGQSVPFITATRYDSVNGQINTVTYEDIGIILRVTPFITSDGLVEMIIAPEISALTDQTVTISQGVNARVISKRSADTVVVTPDSTPVIIGGLMSTEKVSSESKIPFLGDIPYLGVIFKHKTTSDAKTELVICLTPHVVRAPSQLAAMNKSEADKTDLIPESFSERDLNKFLEGIPFKKPVKAKKDKKDTSTK